MNTDIIELHNGFALLSRKCPLCGDSLIWNQTGVECGGCIDRGCPYAEGGEPYSRTKVELCHANRDGDCSNATCPQLRDGEPAKSGRHCPIDKWEELE